MTGLTRKTLVISVAIGIVASLIDLSLARGHIYYHRIRDIILMYPYWFSIQFIINALPEELLFRGIMWGEGRSVNLSNISILCIQSILFWGGHYYYYDMPYNWMATLIAGLLYGIVAWKTKSILASAVVHALCNCLGCFFVFDT
jgi:membrane protease YdiL (CAAX protease family)